MTVRSIEARAIISAADKTGNVFDRIAAKFKGVEKNAKALEGIKAPKFTGDLFEELKRLGLAEKQLQKVRDQMRSFDRDLRAQRPSFSQFARAHQDFATKTVAHWRQVKIAADEAHAAQNKFMTGGGLMRAAAGFIGAGAVGYYAGRAGRYAFDASRQANRETTKQRQAGLTQAQSDAIAAEAERQSKNYPTISQTEFRSAGREAVMQMGNQETGMKMMPTIGRFMTSGKVLWGEDRIEEQTRKALQVLDARQITDPNRANSLLDALIRSSQVEGGPDFKADDLRTALRYGRDMTRGQSDRFITGVLPQLGIDLGYSQAGTGLASMHSALIGGRQKDAAEQFQKKVGLRDKKGKLVGEKLFGSEVDRWFDEHYIPAMKKAGVDTDDAAAVAAYNSRFFSNRTAADVAGNFVSGQAQRIKRREQQQQAKGMEGAETIHTRDVGAALEGVTAQLNNMASSAKLAEASIAGLNAAMGLIQQAGEKMNEPGGWFDRGKKQIESEARDAKTLWGSVGKPIFDWDKRMGVNFGSVVPRWLGGPGTPYPLAEDPMTADQRQRSYPWAEDPMGADYQRRQFHSKEYWNGLGRVRPEGKRFAPSSFAVPGVSDTTTYGTGVGGDKGQVSVTVGGTLEGEGKLTLEINAGSSLIDVVRRAEAAIRMSGQINQNGPGSTGRSSPDAQAPSRTGYSGVW